MPDCGFVLFVAEPKAQSLEGKVVGETGVGCHMSLLSQCLLQPH